MFTSRYKTELSLKARSPRWSLAVKSSCIKRATMYIVYLKYTSYTWALKGLRPATKIEQLGVRDMVQKPMFVVPKQKERPLGASRIVKSYDFYRFLMGNPLPFLSN